MVNDGKTRFADDITLQELVRLRVENEAKADAVRAAFKMGFEFAKSEAADEIERLREALREIYEVYAGSEGIPKPMTAVEGYLLSLFMEVVKIAQEALKEKA